MTFRIKIMWHNIGNVTSLDIDFYFIYFFIFSSKSLLYDIINANNLSEKTSYII